MNACYSYISCPGTQAYLPSCLRSIDSCDSLHVTTTLFPSHLSVLQVICPLTLLLWVSPSEQLSTTQPPGHSPPPQWDGRGGKEEQKKENLWIETKIIS